MASRNLGLGEIQLSGPLEIRLGDGNRTAFVLADRNQNVADIAGEAGAQLGPAVAQAKLPAIFGAVGLGGDPLSGNRPMEDLVEAGRIDTVDKDLVVDTPEERFVRKIGWIEVG